MQMTALIGLWHKTNEETECTTSFLGRLLRSLLPFLAETSHDATWKSIVYLHMLLFILFIPHLTITNRSIPIPMLEQFIEARSRNEKPSIRYSQALLYTRAYLNFDLRGPRTIGCSFDSSPDYLFGHVLSELCWGM